MTMTVEAIKTFSEFPANFFFFNHITLHRDYCHGGGEFPVKDVCRLYDLFYYPLPQFPKLECKSDNKLFSSLMNQLTERMKVTLIGFTSESHQSIYIYGILLPLAYLLELRIYPERYIKGSCKCSVFYTTVNPFFTAQSSVALRTDWQDQ